MFATGSYIPSQKQRFGPSLLRPCLSSGLQETQSSGKSGAKAIQGAEWQLTLRR